MGVSLGATSDERQVLAYLTHQPAGDELAHTVIVRRTPFVIGRDASADFVLPSRRVSKHHAVIEERRHRFQVRDLGSRNGTFVNGVRVEGSAHLAGGDVLRVASFELLFRLEGTVELRSDSTIISDEEVQEEVLLHGRDLYRILTERAVRAVFQPIVRMDDASWIGFEALSRNALPNTDYSPIMLFKIAAEQGRAGELSVMMRDIALAAASELPSDARLFFNLHPAEMDNEDLPATLGRIPEALGSDQRGVIEIHEAAVTDPRAMARVQAQLRDLGLGLAYDDFGAGRSRLMELAEVPPDVIKLDKALIRDIDRSQSRQELVRALVRVMVDQGVEVLAEGVESEAEAEVCSEVGCVLGQGYLWCRPASAADLQRK